MEVGITKLKYIKEGIDEWQRKNTARGRKLIEEKGYLNGNKKHFEYQ